MRSLKDRRRIPKRLSPADTKPLMDNKRMEKTTMGIHEKNPTRRMMGVEIGCIIGGYL